MIPVIAKMGDNIAVCSRHMNWYQGPGAGHSRSSKRASAFRAAPPIPVAGCVQVRCPADSGRRITAGRLKGLTIYLVFLHPIKPRWCNRSRDSTSIRLRVGPSRINRSALRSTNRSLCERGRSRRTGIGAVGLYRGPGELVLDVEASVGEGTEMCVAIGHSREVACEVAIIHRIIGGLTGPTSGEPSVAKNQVAE